MKGTMKLLGAVCVLAIGAFSLAGCASTDTNGQLSLAQLNALARVQNDAAWRAVTVEYPDAIRPTVTWARFTTGPEFLGLLGECTRTTLTEIAKFGATPAPEQLPIAVYTCTARFPQFVDTGADLTSQHGEALYSWDVNVYAPCIHAFGYHLPLVPTKRAFMDSYFAGDPWDPARYVQPQDRADWLTIYYACPSKAAR